MISPNHSTRKLQNQDGRKLRRYKRRWLVERVFAWLMRSRRLVTRDEHKAGFSRLRRARLRAHFATAFLRCVLTT
jgi:transposase